MKGLNACPLWIAAALEARDRRVTLGGVTSVASMTTTAGDGEPGKALSIAAFACMTGRLLDMP